MIDFVRRSARWLATAEYTYCFGVAWLGAMPIPIFRFSANDALKTALLIQLWLAATVLTVAKISLGSLPGPHAVSQWIGAFI